MNNIMEDVEIAVLHEHNTWDKRWMDLAKLVASWSKDRSTKVGAVIVDYRHVLVAVGWNGFPRYVDDDVDARHERPIKYKWTEHAERNAIYNAASKGIPTNYCTMYIPWYPCADCARAILQAGITELVVVEPDWDDERWGDDFRLVKEMFEEVRLEVRYYSEIDK
jgi:dCMP deaminase